MDCDSDVAETDKYAFLLGSALRIEDTDQFFSIYDSIFPQDLPDSQVEIIKEKAREISELPEEKFNDLVCRARHFSLAPTGASMSCPRPPIVHKHIHSYEEEDEGVGSTRMAEMHSRFDDTSSGLSINTVKTSIRSSESETRRLEEDSGVYNSSKPTSLGSWTDEKSSDDERHAADFDYFPPQIKISSGRTLYYDEIHDVETESSAEDVNSPRSDFDQKENRYNGEDGLEMITISSSNEDMPRRSIFQDDFNTSGESDDDCSRAFSYYSNCYPSKSKTPYSYKPKFESLSTSILKNAHVDDTISFRSLEEGTPTVSRYAPYQEYGALSGHSDKVKVEKTSYKNSPPFGSRDQLNKVANSITPLLSGLTGTEAPTNMPPARELKELKSDETKKKKKKKKLLDEQVDENGNPVFSKDKYKQMREAPPTVTASGKHSQVFDSRPNINTDGYFELTQSHRDSDNDFHRAQEKRKRKKHNKEVEKKSEEIENYVGNKSIEELVDFIGGNNAGIKKNKKTVSSNSDQIPGKTVNNKISKKSKDKDKKQKSVTASHSVDKIDEKVEDTAHIDSPEGESEVNKDMGNSGAKTDYTFAASDSVNDIYNDIMKKEKKNFLKDNTQVVTSAIDSLEVIEKKSDPDNDNLKEINKLPESQEALIESDVINVQKKKNPKVQKKDKIERSKDEEAVKLSVNANTAASSVKQKNAKNKKTKPLVAAQKIESPSENMTKDEISGVSSIASDVLTDREFIFTDIDLQTVPNEDEFKVVEKKKKKSTRETQNNYVSVGNIKPSRILEDKRVLPPTTSNKLTASNSSYITKSAENDTRIRDLSPSAFPALSSGQGRIQDGRRNSTGDVPVLSEIALKAQDDSDIESVKSLPATQGSRVVDTMISPRLNMSYAKMAASPKQRGESHDAKISGFVDQNEPERKMAVWKGSPTERRHSIGSSPDSKVGSVNTSSITSNSVKCGSQERLNVDPLSNKGDSGLKLKDQKNSTNVSSKELKDPVLDKTKDINSDTAQTTEIAAKVPLNSISVVQNSGVSQKCDNSVTSINSKNSVNTKTKTNSELPSIKYGKNVSNAKHLNATKNRKPCSVIFLDKRLAEPTNNLGITFGFESEPADKTATDTKSEPKDLDSIHSVAPTVTFLSKDDEEEIISSKQIPSDLSSNSDVIDVGTENTIDTTTKLVHKVGQLNGIIRPTQSPQQSHSSGSDAVNEAQSKGATSNDNSEELKCGKKLGNEIVVYYGENVTNISKNISIPSLTNGPTHYCGKVIFVPETEGRKGAFNVRDAVAFLVGEWDGTLRSKETENRVKTHTEQGAV